MSNTITTTFTSRAKVGGKHCPVGAEVTVSLGVMRQLVEMGAAPQSDLVAESVTSPKPKAGPFPKTTRKKTPRKTAPGKGAQGAKRVASATSPKPTSSPEVPHTPPSSSGEVTAET